MNTEVKEIEYSLEVKELLELRAGARKQKNYQESDRLRDELVKFGYNVKDGPEGQELFKIS